MAIGDGRGRPVVPAIAPMVIDVAVLTDAESGSCVAFAPSTRYFTQLATVEPSISDEPCSAFASCWAVTKKVQAIDVLV